MAISKDFGSSNRRVDVLETDVPADSPLAKKFKRIYWSVVSEKSDMYKCAEPDCNNKSWMAVQKIPIRLKERDTDKVVGVDLLPNDILDLIAAVRGEVVAVCQKHTLDKYADKIIQEKEKN